MSNLREEIEKELHKITQRNYCDIDDGTYGDLVDLVEYFYREGYADGVSESFPILTTSKIKKR